MTILNTFLTLFFEFFKVGLFSVGGGLATIPFLKQIAEKYPWFDVSELSDMIAISESTPGPIGINMATYTGFQAGNSFYSVLLGLLGGFVATCGIVCPAIIVICIIQKFMQKFNDNKFVKNAFFGIRPAVTGLIAGAMLTVFIQAMFKHTNFIGVSSFFSSVNYISLSIFVIFTILYSKLNKLHPIYFIIAGAVLGIVFKL